MLSATATEKCKNCRAREGERHASWCAVGRGRKPKSITMEMEDALAEITGLFGERGCPEIAVNSNDGQTINTYAVPDDSADIVRQARLLLRERGRSPIVPQIQKPSVVRGHLGDD